MCNDENTYKHLIILIMKFLEEENCKESLQALEQESKIFFNLNHFGETIINGEWEKAEKYLAAFTKLDDNRFSRKLFFELHKQRYYEALLSNDCIKAVNIFQKDLEVFSAFENRVDGEVVEPFALEDLRENKQLSWYTNTTTLRVKLHDDLKVLVNRNPILLDKLVLPSVNESALISLINLVCRSTKKKTRSIKEELVYLILQFLDEEDFEDTCHKLEQETKVFFNTYHFREYIINGEWDKAEKYLSAFTKMDDNTCSMKMFSDMQRQKHLEAIERQNKLTSQDAERTYLCDALKVLIEENPILQEKLKFPSMDKSRLLKLIRQIMEWWVPYRVHSMPYANIDTIPLKDFPTVPYLLHAPSFVTNNSSQEAVLATSSDGVCEYPCVKSRDRTSFADANSLVCTKPMEKSVIWKLLQINEPSECCTLVLPDNAVGGSVYSEGNIEYSHNFFKVFWFEKIDLKVVRLMYSCTGDFVLALAQNATHKLWTCQNNKSGWKANANLEPHLYQPSSGKMVNDIGTHSKNAVPCFALKDSFLFSASGGKISIFSLETFETLAAFADPPPTATYFLFLPQCLFAVGLDDSSILIHCLHSKETKAKLKGHQNQITCLAFSYNLNVLVSSGADAQLCVWDVNGWKKKCNKFLQSLNTGRVPETTFVSHIQFHPDQNHLLSVHEMQIDVYKATTLEHIVQLVPQKFDLPITFATYSCDGKSIYVSCKSGCIKVFAATTFELRCQINLTAYAQPNTTSTEIYPLVVAAHPSEPNQIALGLTNGRVHILEPLQSGVEWGGLPPLRDG